VAAVIYQMDDALNDSLADLERAAGM